MAKDVRHSFLLVLTLFLSYAVHASFLGTYQLYIIAIAFVCYYLLRRVIKEYIPEDVQNMGDSLIYVFVITLAIQSSGGLSSPFFFLYYFLLFALSLILEPNISLVFSLGIIGLYLSTAPPSLNIYPDFIPLISLPFMTPFALILGGEYNRIINQKKKIDRLNFIMRTLEKKSAENEIDTHIFHSLIIKTNLIHALNEVEKLPPGPITKSIQNTLKRTRYLIDKFEHINSK